MKKQILLWLLPAAMAAGAQTAPLPKLHVSLSDTTFVGADADARLDKYITELKAVDIDIKAPDGFRSIDMRRRTGFRSYPGITVNCIGLENTEREAVILWPQLMYFNANSLLRNDHNIEGDLRMSHGDIDLDVRPLIEVISEKDMSRYANADTVVIYEYTLCNGFSKTPQPFLDSYGHAVGVYLRKYGHPDLLFKIALTDEGLKHKDDYIRMLLDNVRFGDSPRKDLAEGEQETARRTILNFPTRACRGGIIISPVESALYDNAVRYNGGEEALNLIHEYERKQKASGLKSMEQ